MSVRIAVVGGGVSGLVAAYLLHRKHEITLFEASSRIGGHAHAVSVRTDSGSCAVDTAFIVFNDRYARFDRLLTRLGVASQFAPMSVSVCDEGRDFEYAVHSPNALFAQRRNLVRPAFHRMLVDLVRFNRDVRKYIGGVDDSMSLLDYLESDGYSRMFIDHLIVPHVSGIWQADPRQLAEFPVEFLATFFHKHGQLDLRRRPRWRTVTGTSQRYVERLAEPIDRRIRLDAPVRAIVRSADGVDIQVRDEPPERFDQIVVATHSDQALRILDSPSRAERDILGAIKYQTNDVVLHTDTSLLPRRRRAWASWNYLVPAEPVERPTATYNMNRLQALPLKEQICVTLNRSDRIAPEAMLDRFTYTHPVFSREALVAQRRYAEISGVDRVHFCGAYWGAGFHEDGVVSAERVAERLEGDRL